MTNIIKYSEFNPIYVFDFDDTLVDTPRFENEISKYISENITTEDLLYQSLDCINKDLKDLKWENGRIFINDPLNTIDVNGNWVRKKERVYLLAPHMFAYLDESFPKKLKKLSNLYKSVENKCILTARPETTKSKLLSVLDDLGLEHPKFGVFMRPDTRKHAGIWKGEKIVEMVKDNNFNYVEFYDDNSRYIKSVKEVIKKELPNLNCKIIKVD